jgi:hypothetical protein
VVARWQSLPEAIKVGILAMVDASQPDKSVNAAET